MSRIQEYEGTLELDDGCTSNCERREILVCREHKTQVASPSDATLEIQAEVCLKCEQFLDSSHLPQESGQRNPVYLEYESIFNCEALVKAEKRTSMVISL
ncbi:hypothetical protein HPB50_026451 [Hyalomma asiaticum]|uniref:Uncharacterized protein n=1 Tax=Hyalomma asiaticum TaxID=266040 RepID=A0ACB7T003_HYAAI|nr:hypothetical protein HPB50_026451 [Hyalomma asiaticum]